MGVLSPKNLQINVESPSHGMIYNAASGAGSMIPSPINA